MVDTDTKRTEYKVIAKCNCTKLNNKKLEIVKYLKKWEAKEVERCFKLLIKGKAYSFVYRSFKSNVNSKYKAKIANAAVYKYLTWCKENKVRPKQDKLRMFSGCNKSWVYENCIKDFVLTKDYSKPFQLVVEVELPFEISSCTSVRLYAEVPKKFWKIRSLLYRKGFHLTLNRDKVGVNLVSKNVISQHKGDKVKAIYASPYGGMHIASIRDFELHEPTKDYYEAQYGCSRESKQMLKLLDKIKHSQNKEQFIKDIELFKIKCKTRVNKFFAKLKSEYGKIVFVKVYDNTSKVTDAIQDTYLLQIQKHCKSLGLEFRLLNVSKRKLNFHAKLCMRKSERDLIQDESKQAPNKFKAVAGLKLMFSSIDSIKPVKLGLAKIKKQIETFSENASTALMGELVVDEAIAYQRECAIGFV